jgi:hypothetical protein
MAYLLDCDSCEFSQTVTEEPRTYAVAKEHEEDHPEHFVLILRADPA